MTSTKHEKTDVRDNPLPHDRDRNPGIGQSTGSFGTGEDPSAIEGENTVEGDVLNDTTPSGGVNPKQRGRTNK